MRAPLLPVASVGEKKELPSLLPSFLPSVPSLSLANAVYIWTNLASSIGIVLANKAVFTRHGFAFGTFLTLLHFATTFAGLLLCAALGIFSVKRVSVARVLPLSLAFCGFVVLTNLSLQHNSVGFYQMAKVLTTPCVVLLQWALYGQSFSRRCLAALAVICAGVAFASVNDVSLNLLGTVYALTGVIVTSFYQIVRRVLK